MDQPEIILRDFEEAYRKNESIDMVHARLDAKSIKKSSILEYNFVCER